jgi:hypothetical protein
MRKSFVVALSVSGLLGCSAGGEPSPLATESTGTSSAACTSSTEGAPRPWAHPDDVRVCFVNHSMGDQPLEWALNTGFADYPEFSVHFTGFGDCGDGRADLRVAYRASDPTAGLTAPPPARDLLVFDLDQDKGDGGFDFGNFEATVLGAIAARSGAGSSDVVSIGGGVRLPRASVLRLRELYSAPREAVAYAAERANLRGRGTWLAAGQYPATDLQTLLGDTLGSLLVGPGGASVAGDTSGASLLPGDLMSFDPPQHGASATVVPAARARSSTGATQYLVARDYLAADLPAFAGGHIDQLDLAPGIAASRCAPMSPTCIDLAPDASIDLSTGARLHLAPVVTAYAGARLTGASQALRPGHYYRAADLTALGGVIGSLVVPPNVETTVCSDAKASASEWANGTKSCVRIGPEAGLATSLAGMLGSPAVILRVEAARSVYAPLAEVVDCPADYTLTGGTCKFARGVGGVWAPSATPDGSCTYTWSSPTNDPEDLRALLEQTSATAMCTAPPPQGPGLPGCQACGRYMPQSAGVEWNPLR